MMALRNILKSDSEEDSRKEVERKVEKKEITDSFSRVAVNITFTNGNTDSIQYDVFDGHNSEGSRIENGIYVEERGDIAIMHFYDAVEIAHIDPMYDINYIGETDYMVVLRNVSKISRDGEVARKEASYPVRRWIDVYKDGNIQERGEWKEDGAGSISRVYD